MATESKVSKRLISRSSPKRYRKQFYVKRPISSLLNGNYPSWGWSELFDFFNSESFFFLKKWGLERSSHKRILSRPNINLLSDFFISKLISSSTEDRELKRNPRPWFETWSSVDSLPVGLSGFIKILPSSFTTYLPFHSAFNASKLSCVGGCFTPAGEVLLKSLNRTSGFWQAPDAWFTCPDLVVDCHGPLFWPFFL